MKNKLLVILLSLLLILSGGLIVQADTADVAEQIITLRVKNDNADSLQHWLDTKAVSSAGNGIEWYVMALSHSNQYDFSKYAAALSEKMLNGKIKGAVAQQRCALTLISCGYTNSEVLRIALENSGKQGVMSYIYGLHLLNNFQNPPVSKEKIIDNILSSMIGDNTTGFGWAISGTVPDVDVTAMAVQALAPFYITNGSVKQSVDIALQFLSASQLENGDFKSMGIANPESGSQVLMALSGLGIDCRNDSRFIKNGNTVIDGIMRYSLSNGEFCHIYGKEANQNSSMQAFCAFVAEGLRDKNINFYSFAKNNLYDLTPNDTTLPSGNNSSSQQIPPSTSQNDVPSSENSLVNSNINESTETKDEQQEFLESSEPDNTNNSNKNDNPNRKSKTPWQLWFAIAVLSIVAVCIAILYITKRATAKNIISVIIIAFVLILISLFIKIESSEQYYSNTQVGKIKGTVTLEIVCDEIAEFTKYPDGCIMNACEIEFSAGESVFDVTSRAVRKNGLLIEKNGGSNSVYISGIEGIYEFDYGELSGWVYLVNGESPNVGCASYEAKDGDKIVWAYTTGKEIS
ncbi:MAG: DUF4430 domain-containing protein [Ruminococcaceae bacterium]|nr:DUF4430 domain-containing protein [Oscillospiraceae bacterium]